MCWSVDQAASVENLRTAPAAAVGVAAASVMTSSALLSDARCAVPASKLFMHQIADS